MELNEVLEKALDDHNADDVPALISKAAVRARLKELSGKRVSVEVVEATNLLLNAIIDDAAGAAVQLPGRTFTLQDLQLILGLRQDINLNIGSFTVHKTSQRASKRLVRHLVRQAIKEVQEATEKGDIASLLEKYEVVDDDDFDDDDES